MSISRGVPANTTFKDLGSGTIATDHCTNQKVEEAKVIARIKLQSVPINTYSASGCFLDSSKRRMDLAATRKPIPAGCPSPTRMKINARSSLPMVAPPFLNPLFKYAGHDSGCFLRLRRGRIQAMRRKVSATNCWVGPRRSVGTPPLWIRLAAPKPRSSPDRSQGQSPCHREQRRVRC